MSDNYHTGQGTVIPTLFIGIGGAGSRMVDRIAGRAARLANWETQLRPLTNFVSIDTNELDQHKLQSIPAGNRLNIAAFDKATVIEHFRRSKDEQALQWLDRGYRPRPGYKPGAGQIRVESRLGFFYHSPDIRQRLKELVDSSLRPGITWRQTSPPKYNVYVFCTLAGGTGSGSFLSVAYLVDAVIREQNWQPRIIGNLLLSTLVLDKVGPELHPDIHANTYAALKELEHLTKLDYKQVKDEGRTEEPFVYCRDPNSREIPKVRARPFFLTFIFDRPAHIGLPDPEAAIADAAFLQIFTPLIDNLAGELDNYEKKLEELTRFPGDLRDVGLGYTKNFGAFGAVALILPGEDVLEYCALRFAAQALRRQITFGVDPSDANDDRARALARLAINYSDPKFLRMADEGRERAINQAFVASVQEMARQDAHQELTDGFWYQLVEGVDEGRLAGMDPQGQPIRNEALAHQIERKLEEARAELLNKVAIKERAFVFHKEGSNQYLELVSRLSDDIRGAGAVVGEGLQSLEMAAADGEVIAALKLDPLSERYLVIRLLDLCEKQWIPEAQQQLDKAGARDINNPKVRERLERELFQSLQEAAGKWSLFNRDQAFLDARDEAQEYYRGVAAGARKIFDAQIRLRQLRALLAYLQRRSRQYAGLATRMDVLVQDLEREAERLRRGETAIVPPLALRVEVFETLDEPRQRLWDQVYRSLFLDGGRYIATFDRQLLAETIARELKPIVRPDGTVVDKTIDQSVSDLRRALCELGRRRLRPTILGDAVNQGLDLTRGLELEAQLLLGATKQPGEQVSTAEIAVYREQKFRALAQLAGVLARVNTAEAKALDDGVEVNRTRQLILENMGAATAAEQFQQNLENVLAAGGRQVKEDTWHDPRLIIVHDVELPIPLYYFPAVIGDIEEAYRHQATDERRSYNLHTDYNWEKALPNLNPRRSELTVGWSLTLLAKGLVTRVVALQDGMLIWHIDEQGKTDELGKNFSSALYRIGEMHRIEDLQKEMEKRIREAQQKLWPGEEQTRCQKLVEQFTALLNQMNRREVKGEMRREDILDRPILRALIRELSGTAAPESVTSGSGLYSNLDLG
ncbi:MAG: tubulin-like doman-containing protein [Candidatus Competibacteraceae bacterium]